jgi:hypothetical protein
MIKNSIDYQKSTDYSLHSPLQDVLDFSGNACIYARFSLYLIHIEISKTSYNSEQREYIPRVAYFIELQPAM